MKIVVIGGTGLIGSKTVTALKARGHDVAGGAPSTGVDTYTGAGLAEVLVGAEVVIDLAKAPSFEDGPAMDFFQTAGRNLLAAGKVAGVRHHIALSVVGTAKLQGSGYFRAKQAQEDLIRASGLAYAIIHSTQFMEFIGAIARSSTVGDEVRLSPARAGRNPDCTRPNGSRRATIRRPEQSCGCAGGGSVPSPRCAALPSCRSLHQGVWDRRRGSSSSRPMHGTAGHRSPSCSRTRPARSRPAG